MRANRWFHAMLIAAALAVPGVLVTPAFAQARPTPDPQEGHDPKQTAAKIEAALAKLSETDRTAATTQRYCPMMDTVRLGAMGTPIKLMIEGKPVFVCCEHCKEDAAEDAKATLAKAEKLKKATAAVAKLPQADQPIAEAQLFCPIHEGGRLGSMGTPVKLMLDGKPVFLCCKGCEDAAREDTKATLAKVEKIKKDNAHAGHHGDGHDHKHGAAAHEHKKGTAPKK